jgi:hypothetical protein
LASAVGEVPLTNAGCEVAAKVVDGVRFNPAVAKPQLLQNFLKEMFGSARPHFGQLVGTVTTSKSERQEIEPKLKSKRRNYIIDEIKIDNLISIKNNK